MTKSKQDDFTGVSIQLVEYLKQFVTPQRLEKIEQTLDYRTRYLTVVLEDLYQTHNASAVIRSCEIFGIQNVHIVENENEFSLNPEVVLGASKWLNVVQYNELENNTKECLSCLKKQGYRIVAASPHENDFLLEELPLDKKTALVFGAEMRGISSIVAEMADGFVKIPMYGFTESLNISVSVAICLYQLYNKLRNSNQKWNLTEQEKLEIKLEWLKNSIKNPEMIIERYLKTKGSC